MISVNAPGNVSTYIASTDGGRLRPSVLGGLRLTSNSYLVGACRDVHTARFPHANPLGQSQLMLAHHRALKSVIACSRVTEYPRVSTDGGISRAVIVQNHGLSFGACG